MISNLFRRFLGSALIIFFAATNPVFAGDWPHWLGPTGENIAPDNGGFDAGLSHWKVAWKTNVGLGYSAVTVAGERAFTMGHDGKSQETVFCFNASSGEVIWKFPYDAQLMPQMHPGGPNASPTVIGNKILTVSKDGQMFCLSDKGAKLWQTNLTDVLGIKLPQWGFASSPVVDKGRVFFSSGKVAALDLETGKTLWVSKSDYPPAYPTPVIFSLDGKEFVAALDGKGFSVLSGKDGAEIAHRPFRATYDLIATTPFVFSDGKRIFISGNISSEMLGFDGRELSLIWSSTEIKNAMNNSVIFGDVIYGIDGRQQTERTRFVSVNAKDGKVNWAKDNFGYGNVIGVGKMLLALTEAGELVTIKPSPEQYNEVSRLKVLEKLCWTTPVYASGKIYVRNDAGEVVCLSLNAAAR